MDLLQKSEAYCDLKPETLIGENVNVHKALQIFEFFPNFGEDESVVRLKNPEFKILANFSFSFILLNFEKLSFYIKFWQHPKTSRKRESTAKASKIFPGQYWTAPRKFCFLYEI